MEESITLQNPHTRKRKWKIAYRAVGSSIGLRGMSRMTLKEKAVTFLYEYHVGTERALKMLQVLVLRTRKSPNHLIALINGVANKKG